MQILVVDDDPLAGEMTAAILEASGYTVSLVENAVDALAGLDADPAIGLVISDMHMPLVSGLELFRTLREQGRATPFVILTGDDPATVLAEAPGLTGCLAKDGALETSLLSSVRGILGGP